MCRDFRFFGLWGYIFSGFTCFRVSGVWGLRVVGS